MGNLLRAEFYKLVHKRGLWGTLLAAFFLERVLLPDGLHRTAVLWRASLYNAPQLYFLLMIFGALFIGDEFENGTLYGLIAAGHRRGNILFAKTVAYQAACVLIVAAPLSLHVPSSGFAPEFLHCLPLVLAAVFAMGMLPLLAAFLLRDMGKTLAVPLALYALMIFVLNGEYSAPAMRILPVGHLRLIALGSVTDAGGALLAVDIAWIVVLYALAYFCFCRRDLR